MAFMHLREGIFFTAVSMSMILGCGNATNTSEGKQSTGGTTTGSFASGGAGGTATASSFASGGTGGAAQGQGSGQGSGGALAATGPDGFPAVCVNSLPLIPGEREPLTFSLKLELNGKPLIYGENNALAGGGTLLLSNLRFYISEVNLVDASNQRVPVDLVDSGGQHRKPYNVHFVNAEAPESLGLRVRAPVGTYSGVEFLLGLTDGCNNTFSPLDAPLDEASQLKWPHTFGYLFLRYEGMVTEPLTIMPSTAQKVHMGGGVHERMAPKISVLGAITVAKANAEIPLKFALDEVLKGAAMPADLANFMLPPPAPPGPPGAEIVAGEHLRQNVPKLTIFSLSGP